MPQYLLAVYDQEDTRTRSPEEMAPIFEAVGAFNEKAMEAGIFVFAGGLDAPESTTTIDARSGTPEVKDGPYLEGKEHFGGFWVLELPDLDTALQWAKEGAIACQQPVELRPFMAQPPSE